MKKNECEKKTFCFIQENNLTDRRLLCALITLNTIEKGNTNCIIVCKKKTKEFINSFPISMKLKLHFIITSKKKFQFIDIYRYILKTLNYGIKRFGDCIFIRDSLIMTHKLNISPEIKNQGYAFHKRIFNSHDKENDKCRYNSEVLYVNNPEFITQIESLLEIPNFHKKNTFTKKEQSLFYKNINTIEYKYKEKYNTQYFLPYETIISTEDFFSFDNKLNLKDITKELTWEDKKISFLAIRLEKVRPQVKSLNEKLYKLLLMYDVFYSNIIYLGNLNETIKFLKPFEKNIGIWDRQNNSKGLYDVIDMFIQEYPRFCSSVSVKTNHFSVMKYAILDKPGVDFLSNELYSYNYILGTYCDANQVKTIKEDKMLNNFNFGFYFFENPKWLDEYYYNHKDLLSTLPRTNESCSMHQEQKCNNCIYINNNFCTYDKIIDILTDTKFIFLKKFDSNLMVLCFAFGCIPIFESLDIRPFDLEWDKHYLFLDLPCDEEREQLYKKMQKNVLDYYEKHISPKNAFKTLVNHFFIRDIE